MKKKLTSFLLGALLLGQSSPLLAVNTEAEPVHTPAPITPHTETFFEKYRKFIIGGACALGVGAIATPIIYYLTHSGKDNQTIHNFAYRQLLKEAVRRLYVSNRELVMSFPAKKANDFLNNSKNWSSDNTKSVLIACALYESFKTSLKDSDITSDELLFVWLESIIPENSNCDLEETLTQHVKLATEYVKNPQLHIPDDGGTFTPTYKAFEGHKWDNIVASRSYRDTQDQFMKDAASKWTQTPIRALAWHGNMCYFNGTLMLFFHNPVFYELIMNIDHAKAKKLINDPATDDKIKANLECIVYLSNLFNAMTGTNKGVPQVIALKPKFEQELFEAIKNARIKNSDDPNYGVLLNHDMPYNGKGGVQFASNLFKIIKNSKEVLYPTDHAELPEPTTNADRFVNCPQVRLLNDADCTNFVPNVEDGGHYWVRIEFEEGKYLSIGEGLDIDRAFLSQEHTEVFAALHTILKQNLTNGQKIQITTNVPDDLWPENETIPTGIQDADKDELHKFNILLGLSRALKENNLDPTKNYNLYNQLTQYFLLQKWKLTDLEQNKTPDYLENFLNEITENSEDIVKNTWKLYLNCLCERFRNQRLRINYENVTDMPALQKEYKKLFSTIQQILKSKKINDAEFSEHKKELKKCVEWHDDDVRGGFIFDDTDYAIIDELKKYVVFNRERLKQKLEHLNEEQVNGGHIVPLQNPETDPDTKKTKLEYNTLLLLKTALATEELLNVTSNETLRKTLKDLLSHKKLDPSELAKTLGDLLERVEEIRKSAIEISQSKK